MITRVNPLGHISLTNDYFSGLVAEAAKNCYGIAAMGQSSAASTVREALRNGSLPEKGVTVSQQEGRLVDLVGHLVRHTAAAHEGIYPGGKLRRREGLGHIVVRAGHQAGHLIHLLRACS